MTFDNEFFERERTYLLKMTMRQVPKKEQAEELVQEAMMAAFEAKDRFSGKSSPRTWMTGILKHKIIDFFRKKYRAHVVSLDEEDSFDRSLYDGLFEDDGRWRADGVLEKWPSAEKTMQDNQFWEVLESCLKNMPERTAAIFAQREIMGEDIESLCNIFSISATNISVILYRARMTLRKCLEEKWINK